MTELTWPPPIAEATVWRTRVVRVRQTVRWPFREEKAAVSMREVVLWGRLEWIDSSGRVFCEGCRRLIEMAELCRQGNGHLVSPVRGVVSGSLRPCLEEQVGCE